MSEPAVTETPKSVEVPAGILRARAALRRDLPTLLADSTSRGQWACYSGDVRIGIGDDYLALIRECVRLGIQDEDYIIERVTPTAGGEEEEEIESRDM